MRRSSFWHPTRRSPGEPVAEGASPVRGRAGYIEPASDAEPVVERHDNHAIADEAVRVEDRGPSRAGNEATAVDEDEYRAGPGPVVRRPDVDRQVVDAIEPLRRTLHVPALWQAHG